MILTTEAGKRSASVKAEADSALYRTARQRYGVTLITMQGDAPIGLLLGHVLRVNRALQDAPPVQKDRRRGFMKASINEAKTVNIREEQLDEPPTCAFVFGREINRAALSLYTTYSGLFTRPDVNFWKTAYLYVVLGAATFRYLWSKSSIGVTGTPQVQFVETNPRTHEGNWEVVAPTSTTYTNATYDTLIYTVNSLTKSPPGWQLAVLKKLILVDCEYVFQLWSKYGAGKLFGFGSLPVLRNDQMRTIMNRVK